MMTSGFQGQYASMGAGRRWLGVGACLLLAWIEIGCGDVYRPVALPIVNPNQPNPSALHFVYSLASDGSQNRGSLSQIDVTGDVVTTIVPSGLAPVHGTLSPDGSRFYMANSGDDTVSVASGASGAHPTIIDLVELCPAANPCPAMPVFVHTTENGRVYVADQGNGTVSIISATSNVVIQTVAVDPAFAPPNKPVLTPNPAAQPVALAEMPNAAKIYSVNKGDSTVTAINTQDGSIAARITGFSAPPVWAVASVDSAYIYVLDSGGKISVIDTLTDQVVSSASAGAGANFIYLDKVANRLYVTNPSNATVSIFDTSGNALIAHSGSPISIAPAAASACTTAAAAASQPIPPAVPTAVTVLSDGSRAYVASYQTYTAGGLTSVCTQADVINTGTSLMSTTIPLSQATDNSSQTGCSSARFRVFVTASAGGTNSPLKVFVSQCDAGSIADIYTFAQYTGPDPHGADVLMANLPAPVNASSSAQVSISGATQSSNGNTTYTYSQLSGPSLQVGTLVIITGMSDVGNNGVFVVNAVSGAQFTVTNSSGVNASSQSGNGTGLAVGNPVFLVAGL